MPDDIHILGFTEHEVELVLVSFQCIKPSKRFAAGWEVGMKDFADLTNTNISDARAQWKDLSSRLLKIPRLPRKSLSPEQRHESEEIIEECIIVKDDMDHLSPADDSVGRKAKGKVSTKRKGKQVARPSVLDNIGATNKHEAKRRGGGVPGPSNIEDRTKRAWADIGDGMTEEKWNGMGDKLAL